MRYLLAVAREKTLSGAARSLGVRHTTVGRRLAALEQALGVPLVRRGPGGVELTPTGSKLLPHGEDLERTMRELLAITQADGFRVRLAIPSGFGRLFAERIAAFHKAHPDITLDLTSGSRPVDLQHGEADLAVRAGPIADDTLIARKLCGAGWSLYASQAYLDRRGAPPDPRRLAGHDVIGFDASLAGVPGAKWIAAHGDGATIVLRLAEMTDMLTAALSGAGLAVLPCMLAEGEPHLRRLTPDSLGSHPLSLVYRREVGRQAPIRAVIRFVASTVKANEALIEGKTRSGAG